jgi:hypothetical protein
MCVRFRWLDLKQLVQVLKRSLAVQLASCKNDGAALSTAGPDPGANAE